MKFIETSVFTKQVANNLSDDEYRELQATLIIEPDAGAVIRGSGGVRKLRWKTRGGGKSGGFRIIYYWYVSESTVLMLTLYRKNQMENLSPNQVRILRRLVEEELL